MVKSSTVLILVMLWISGASGFVTKTKTRQPFPLEARASASDPSDATAAKFEVLVCSSTACTKRRRQLMQDDLSLFVDLYSRLSNNLPDVRISESPCLGGCQRASCVGIQHDDFEGSVAIEGMTEAEFAARTFFHVDTDEDAERVWHAVTNAVDQMREQEEEEEEYDEEYEDTGREV